MLLLLDTHALIWFLKPDRALSTYAQMVIESEKTDVHVSVISLWEISIKTAKGALDMVVPL